MSRKLLAATLLLCCPGLTFAQGEVPASQTQQDPLAAYNDLVKALTQAVTDWRKDAMKQVAEAKKNNKPMPAIAMAPPTGKFIDQAHALAKQYAGEDVAIQFHAFVLKYASQEKDAVKMSVKTLTMDHAESADIGDALPFLGNAVRMGAKSEAMELFGQVIDSNPLGEAKANALIERGKLLLEAATNDDELKAAQADLERVKTVTEDADLIASAEDALFEVRHLQVGFQAPDIVAMDVDGVEFKLSDYRGKVVLLDFWGFW